MRTEDDSRTEVRLRSPSGQEVTMKMRKAPACGRKVLIAGKPWTIVAKTFTLPVRARGAAA